MSLFMPETLDGMASYVPVVAVVVSVVSASYAPQVTPSAEIACWITTCLIVLVPATMPLHVSVISPVSYTAGEAVKAAGAVGGILQRTLLLETNQSE